MDDHTPGPWVSNGSNISAPKGVCPMSQNEPLIAILPWDDHRRPHEDEIRANGHLVRAALELLEALESVEWGDSVDKEEGGLEAGCPSCGGAERLGHDDPCQLKIAIKAARGS